MTATTIDAATIAALVGDCPIACECGSLIVLLTDRRSPLSPCTHPPKACDHASEVQGRSVCRRCAAETPWRTYCRPCAEATAARVRKGIHCGKCDRLGGPAMQWGDL